MSSITPKHYEHSISTLDVAPSASMNCVYAHEGLNEDINISAEFQRILEVGKKSVFDSYKISLNLEQAKGLIKALNKVIEAVENNQYQSNDSWYYMVVEDEFIL